MQLCESCSEPLEMQSVVRGHNRTLRRIVHTLRQRVQTNKSIADELFINLCETDPQAELAFRELWERGGFQPPIGPRDYGIIVERCLAALSEYNDSHTSLSSSVACRNPEAAD